MELDKLIYNIRNNKLSYISYNFSTSEKEDKDKIKTELKDNMAFLTQEIESLYGIDNFDKNPTNEISPHSISAGFNYGIKSDKTVKPLTTILTYKIDNHSEQMEASIDILILGDREDMMLDFYHNMKEFPELTMSKSAKTNINSLDFILKGEYKKHEFGLMELM